MPLKAQKPETMERRLKLFMWGPAGVGKTTAAIQFPNAVILDLEKGTGNYTKSIAKSGSVVLQTVNPDEVRDEIRSLLTEKHPYKTLIIDPITQLYNSIQEKWNRIFEKHATNEKQAELQDFGPRYWGRVKSEYKAIQRMLMALDMNIIVLSHQKDIYASGMQKVGVGPDAMKGDEYVYDFVFQLENVNGKRMAKTVKERAEIGLNKFPPTFEWSYQNFKEFYGAEIIEKEASPIVLATKDQVIRVKELLDIVKIDETEITKWLTKADVDSFEEMTGETIGKIILYLQKKLETVKK